MYRDRKDGLFKRSIYMCRGIHKVFLREEFLEDKPEPVGQWKGGVDSAFSGSHSTGHVGKLKLENKNYVNRLCFCPSAPCTDSRAEGVHFLDCQCWY